MAALVAGATVAARRATSTCFSRLAFAPATSAGLFRFHQAPVPFRDGAGRRSNSSWRGADVLDSMLEVDELFDGNDEWRKKCLEKDPKYFDNMAVGQRPRYLWIGCSDSRVPCETLCNLSPGSLFVHRNIANMITNVDVSAMSVLQYAVTVLKVQHIVICGHYDCGGVAAALKNVDHQSPLENWLRNLRDVYRLHRKELDAIEDIDARRRRLVEINVVEQAVNLYKTRVVQARRVETYKNLEEYQFVQPKIHPVVYNPGTGKLTRLNVQMQDVLKDLQGIYNLYSAMDEDSETEWHGMGPSYVSP